MLRSDHRLQRGEFRGHVHDHKLKDLLGSLQSFEGMKAQVANLEFVGEVVGDQLLGRQRHEDLSAVGQRAHSGAAVDCRAIVVTFA